MSNKVDEETVKGIVAIAGAGALVALAPLAIYWWALWKRTNELRFTQKRALFSGLMCLALALAWIFFLDRFPLYQPEAIQTKWTKLAARGLWAWGFLFQLSYLLAPLILRLRRPDPGIRTKDFGGEIGDLTQIRSFFHEQRALPIGLDVKTGSIVSVSETQRTAHVLVIGATGTGKTTAMMNMILHAIRHNHPCVIVDPKGEDSTLDEVIALGRKLDPGFDQRFQLFSMSKPTQSYSYNPLKHGNANQLKDRVMEALTWSEQYYQSVAGSFLSELTAVMEYLGRPLTLSKISRILSFKEEQAELLNALKDQFQSKPGNDRALELREALGAFFGKNKEDALSGLAAQISILNNHTFGSLLSFESAKNEIDFREARSTKKISYFQLDTLGNADSARRLGRMIIEDLKSLASEVYKKEQDSGTRVFFPVFIDEFGSFATKEFIEFLKQSRGAKFGIHLFCQGLEDLDSVSPEFRRQVISNTMTKIGLRMDDHETVNEICATAGTFDALEQSYQVEGNLLVTKTGMGNLRHTKQMQIEHDVFKQLRTGEAVVIQKSPSKVNGIKICRANSLI